MPSNINQQSTYSPTSSAFTSQGNYYGFNDAAITAISFSPANVTNPRIDLVVATAQDAGYAGATNNWVVQVVTGTAAGSPLVPAIPANSVVLAQVSIAANATTVINANITDARVFYSPTRSFANYLQAGAFAGSGTGTAVRIGDFGDANGAHVKAVSSSTNSALYLQSQGTGTGAASAIIFADSSGSAAAYFTIANGISNLDTTLVIGRQLASTFSLQRVTQGAVDSGGSGFRALIVPN